jgi:predicted PurR-regulated permease PerM
MENKNLTINISTAAILKIIAIGLALFFAYFIRDIILIVLISVFFAALIEPMVNQLERIRIPRVLGVLLIYLFLLLFLVLIIRPVIPPIAEQVAILSNNFPELWGKIQTNFNSFKDFSIEQGLADNIQQGLDILQSKLQQAASNLYYILLSIFQSVINFFLILIITFYIVVEKEAVNKVLKIMAPDRYHQRFIDLYNVIQQKIGDWARGQILLCLIVGSMAFIGLLFLMPKYAFTLALLVAVTELIPYLGPTLGAIPAIFLAFTVEPFSLWRGFIVLILYIFIQEAENNLIVPAVMKKQLNLNPVVVIVVMLIGARLAGIIGLILAVPVAMAIGVVAKDFMGKSTRPKLKIKTFSQK